jgi:DNA repair exonuclease SbcCD ATPase subunit
MLDLFTHEDVELRPIVISACHAPDELTLLRQENVELRARMDSLERALIHGEQMPEVSQAAPAGGSPTVTATEEPCQAEKEKEKTYEALLEEKSEIIRNLHMQIHELRDAGGARFEPATGASGARALKKQLEDERRQVKEAEAELSRMQQMEKAMSKDRAELAQQRSEIERFQQELSHQVETASREPALFDRLVALQRIQGGVQANGRR